MLQVLPQASEEVHKTAQTTAGKDINVSKDTEKKCFHHGGHHAPCPIQVHLSCLPLL